MNTLEKAQRRVDDCLTIYGEKDKIAGDDKSVFEIAKALIEAVEVIEELHNKFAKFIPHDDCKELSDAREFLNSVKGG